MKMEKKKILGNKIATILDKIEKTWSILSLLPREINLKLLSQALFSKYLGAGLASSCL